MLRHRIFFRICICAAGVFLCFSCLSEPDRKALASEYMVLAEGYVGLEKYDQALFFYRKAALESSHKNAAEYGIGKVYALSGDWRNATKVFESLYEQEPENEILISSYAYALAASGEVEKALPVYKTRMEKHPDDARIAADYVELLFVAGLYDEVRREAAAVNERFPDNPELSSLSDIEKRIEEAVEAERKAEEAAANPPTEDAGTGTLEENSAGADGESSGENLSGSADDASGASSSEDVSEDGGPAGTE